VPGGLITNTNYYWGITASDGMDTSAGPVWRFTTSGTAVLPRRGVKIGMPSAIVVYQVPVTNTGTAMDTFDVLVSGNAWPVSVPSTVGPLRAGIATTLPVTVTTPRAAGTVALADTVTVVLKSANDSTVSALLPLTTRINPSGIDIEYAVYLPVVLRDL
jgi:hypothetical protein